MKSFRVLISLLVAALLVVPALAGERSLDGKTFTVTVTLPDGKTMENMYTFKDGMVESALCAKAGYPAAPYTTKDEGGKTLLTAILENDSGDTRKISATIHEGKMKGTVDVSEGGETMQLKFSPRPAMAKKG